MQEVTIELLLRTSMSDEQLSEWVHELLEEVHEHLLPSEEVSVTRTAGQLFQRKPWNNRVVKADS